MKMHSIPLESLLAKRTTTKIENCELRIPAEAVHLGKARNHVSVPGKYKLPFSIDMTVKAKYAEVLPIELTLYIGNGKVFFNGGHTNCTDVLTVSKGSTGGDASLTSFVAYNDMPTKEYADISITFGSKMMWITVDDKICYASDKMPYIEMLPNSAELDISICGGTYTKLAIKNFAILEYENDEPEIPAELKSLPEYSPFELFVEGLPPVLQAEMVKTDEFLMGCKKLKFRRTIDSHGHLVYQSPCGLQYNMPYFGVQERHGTNWVQSPKKLDRTSEVLSNLAETSPGLADKLFANINVCNPHKRECKRRTTIAYKGDARLVCRGAIALEWLPVGFEDLKKLAEAAEKI